MLDSFIFPEGLVGLPDLHRFAVRSLDEAPFLLLDCLDDPDYGFVAVEADVLRPGLADELRAAGAIPTTHDLIVLLSVHGDPPEMTANLAGPVAVDRVTGQARQAVLEGDAFPLRAPVMEVG